MNNLAVLQHSVLPSNSKANNQYVEYDNVDFMLDFNGRKMLGNTLKISGRLAYRQNGNKLADASNVYFDTKIGIHGAIDTITTTTEAQGTIESISEVARYVGMLGDATETSNTTGGNLSRTIELKTFADKLSNTLLVARETNEGTADPQLGVIDDDLSFVFKPECCLNKVSGASDPNNVSISYTKTGSIRLSLRVARLAEFFYGTSLDNTSTYYLTDLKAHFLSVPEDGVKNTVIMEVKNHIKQSILSRNSNLSLRVPMVATSFSGSFLQADKENSLTFNTRNRDAVNDLENLQFLFNNNTMDLITYEMDDRVEIERHYIKSLGTGKQTSVTPVNNNSGKSYGIGLSFEPVDLTNNSFNVQLEADSFDGQSYVLYAYFRGIQTI